MVSRFLIGLSIGSGREGVDVALIRMSGLGLEAVPRVEKHARIPFLPLLREALKHGQAHSREVGEALASAVRQLIAKTGIDLRAVQLIGLHAPVSHDLLSEYLAEMTGVTVWSRFAARDIAAGGSGWPFTAMSDYLFTQSSAENHLLIHLGSKTSALYIRAGSKVTDLVAFDAGPGCELLDDFIRVGTNEKESLDAGGTRAVQGRCLEDVLSEWQLHPYFSRKAPKALGSEFRNEFVSQAIEAAKQHEAGLADLLCTATHFIARGLGAGCRAFLPVPDKRTIALSGGGVRNGFLWQLVQQQFPEEPIRRTDELGLPALGRTAAAAGVLAGLTLDGVAVNLPLLTGASGARLVGRFTPGDPRNWATVTHWAAKQMWDYLQLTRAA